MNFHREGIHFLTSGYAFYGILVLAVCVTGCCPTTLIPVHNSVINPQFWYEVLISFLPLTFFIAGSFVIRAQKVFNCFSNRMKRITFDLSCWSFLATVVFCVVLHFVWIKIFGYIEPVPWKCIMMGYICSVIISIRLWHVFPKEMVKEARLGALLRHLNIVETMELGYENDRMKDHRNHFFNQLTIQSLQFGYASTFFDTNQVIKKKPKKTKNNRAAL